MNNEKEFPHYFRDVRHLDKIDFYRIADLYGIHDPCVAHALKKILALGQRGAKDVETDAKDVIKSMERFLDMRVENAKHPIKEMTDEL